MTPEQYQPAELAEADGQPVVWEACQTLNGSWGYDRDNLDWKTPDMLVRMLVDGVAKGGNLLLNVGPTARGEFDPRAPETLRRASATGCACTAGRSTAHGRATSTPPPDCRYTQRGDRLYLHLFAWPFRARPPRRPRGKVAYAQLLNDASEIAAARHRPGPAAQNTTMGGQPAGTLTLELPIQPARCARAGDRAAPVGGVTGSRSVLRHPGRRHPSVNGSRVAPDVSIHTDFVSVYSWSTSIPFSRPMPLDL